MSFYLSIFAFTNMSYASLSDGSVWSFRELVDYGALGFFCLFLVGAVVYLIRAHRIDREVILKNHADERLELHRCHAAERKQWKYTTDKQHEESVALGKQVVEVLSEVKGAINTNRSNL